MPKIHLYLSVSRLLQFFFILTLKNSFYGLDYLPSEKCYILCYITATLKEICLINYTGWVKSFATTYTTSIKKITLHITTGVVRLLTLPVLNMTKVLHSQNCFLWVKQMASDRPSVCLSLWRWQLVSLLLCLQGTELAPHLLKCKDSNVSLSYGS